MDVQVPLNKLHFGHEVGDGINARVAGRLEGIDALAANIFARGLIENLVVYHMFDDEYGVSNGNRRLAALRQIYGPDGDEVINCTLRKVDEAGAFEDSLTTAVLAHQLHPVDQYEAFARMVERGKVNEEIALQYGMSEKEVRQALALGQLSPKIRDAWRRGDIKAEVARAFTLGVSHKTQDKAFAKLQKAGMLYEGNVKRELGATDREIGDLMTFVGTEAYRAAGGELVEDLFGTSHVVSKPELLKQMATEKLAKVCTDLVAEGWLWAELATDLPQNAKWSWSKSEPKVKIFEGNEEARLQEISGLIQANNDRSFEDESGEFDEDEANAPLEAEEDAIQAAVYRRSFTDRQKKKAGCIVEFDGGIVSITYGVTKPDAVSSGSKAKATSKAIDAASDAGGAAAEEPAISQSLLHRLSVQLTDGAATALSQDLELAMIVLLAGIALGHDHQVRVSVRGLGAARMNLLGGADLADNMTLLKNMDLQGRVALLTTIAAATLDFQNFTLDMQDRHTSAVAVCDALDQKSLNAALRGVFDAKDYFSGVSKGLALAAIGEALGPDIERQQAKGKRPEIAAFAIENVAATGWLPKQLRAKGYDGPGTDGYRRPGAGDVDQATAHDTASPKTKRAAKSAARKPAKKAAAKKAAKKAAKR